jgi:UDP-2,4-diacetamido-2,4,6-trideoxy-beta-L-altropyranose hydrolase
MNPLDGVAFRADAGVRFGIGHIRRCRSLAEAFCDAGVKDICLVMKRHEGWEKAAAWWPYSLKTITDYDGHAASVDKEEQDAQATFACLADRIPSRRRWMVLDHYELSCAWERMARNAGYRVLALEDFRDRVHSADMLVSDSSVPFDPQLNRMTGPSAALAGRAYALVDRRCQPRPSTAADASRSVNILISYGGSDPTGETVKAMHALRGLHRDESSAARIGRITVVVGPVNREEAEIRAVAKRSGAAVHIAPADLVPLLADADLVLTAGGTSMIEALAMKKICLVTTTATNQHQIVSELSSEHAIIALGTHDSVLCSQITSALHGVLARFDQLAAENARRTVFDNLGAQRVVSRMMAFPLLPASERSPRQ